MGRAASSAARMHARHTQPCADGSDPLQSRPLPTWSSSVPPLSAPPEPSSTYWEIISALV